jgi:hypothetical protein
MWRTEINNWVAISLYKHAGRRVQRPCAARCELTTQRIAAHACPCVHSLSTLDAKVRLISLSDCVEHYRVSDAFVGGPATTNSIFGAALFQIRSSLGEMCTLNPLISRLSLKRTAACRTHLTQKWMSTEGARAINLRSPVVPLKR